MSHLKLSMEVWANMPWGRLEICGCAVNSWGKIPLHELVYKIKEHGYTGMDVVFSTIQEIPPEHYDEELAKFKKALEDTGVHLASLGAHATFVTPRHFDRTAGLNTMKQAIDAAAYLGADTVCSLIAQGFYDPALYNIMTRKEAWDMVVSGVRECAEYAKAKNMTISVEILQGTLINGVDQWFKLYNEVGMDNVYVTVDTGTFYTTVKPKMPIPEAIRKLGKHINCVHVKDEVGFPNIIQSQHVWYGGGLVDFREMAGCLKEVGYEGYCAVEWEGWQNGGLNGVGDPGGLGLYDFDMVASEAKLFLEEEGWC